MRATGRPAELAPVLVMLASDEAGYVVGADPTGFCHVSARGIGGLTQLPCADGVNGRIGSFEIRVSVDGVTWSVLATGAWSDTTDEKTVAFTAVGARYIRSTATSVAENLGPWSSAAEINLLGPQLASSSGSSAGC